MSEPGDPADPFAAPAADQPRRDAPDRPNGGQPPYGQPPYGQPQYGQPQYGGQPRYAQQPPYPGQPYGGTAYPRPARNGMGVSALVLGILALVSCWTVLGGVLLGVLGVVFGVVGRRRAGRGEADNGGVALAGLICAALAVAVSVILLVVYIVVLARHPSAISRYRDCLRQATTAAQRGACAQQFQRDLQNGR